MTCMEVFLRKTLLSEDLSLPPSSTNNSMRYVLEMCAFLMALGPSPFTKSPCYLFIPHIHTSMVFLRHFTMTLSFKCHITMSRVLADGYRGWLESRPCHPLWVLGEENFSRTLRTHLTLRTLCCFWKLPSPLKPDTIS